MDSLSPKTIKLQLLINDIPLCGLHYFSINPDIISLFNEFINQASNVLKNGYCGEEKIEDLINNGRAIELQRLVISSPKIRNRK